jgi:hypothetical protein
MRYLILSSSFAVAAAIMFACTYGNYDGSFDGGIDGGDGGGEAGKVVAEKTIDPAKLEKLTTSDGAFEVTFAPATFDGPAKIVITRLADRLLNNNLFVPTYGVASDKPAGQAFEVKFMGNNPNGGDIGTALVPALATPDGTFRPTPMVGAGGGTSSFWGLTRNVGTFSLVFEPFDQTSSYQDVAPDSCIAQCCASGGAGNAAALGGSCACTGPPNLECFIRACKPHVAGAVERCVEIANTNKSRQPIACTNSLPVPPCNGGPPQCGYPSICSASTGVGGTCCINAHAGQCLGTGSPGGTSCAGIAIRCDNSTPCPEGTQCCVFDNDAYCASTCPNDRTWCVTQGECDGGAAADGGPEAGPSADGPCFAARNCPHGTCGPPPTACTN